MTSLCRSRSIYICILLGITLFAGPLQAQEMEYERLSHAAATQFNLRRLAESERLLVKALAVSEAFPPFDIRRADTLRDLGVVSAARRRFIEAEAHLMRSLLIREQIADDQPDGILGTLDRLAVVLRLAGRLERAEHVAERALALRIEQLGPRHPEVADALVSAADVALARGRADEAETRLRAALDIRKEAVGHDNLVVADLLASIGRVCETRGRLDEARKNLTRASKIYEKLAPRSVGHAAVLEDLADVLVRSEKLLDAERLLRRAIGLRTSSADSGAGAIARSMRKCADILRQAGRDDDAERLEKRATDLMADHVWVPRRVFGKLAPPSVATAIPEAESGTPRFHADGGYLIGDLSSPRARRN